MKTQTHKAIEVNAISYGYGHKAIGEHLLSGTPPYKIGDVLIGKKSWYKNPPRETLGQAKDGVFQSADLCPMRGTRRAFMLEHDRTASLPRKYEWEYRIYRRLGERIGRQNKDLVFVPVKKRPMLVDGHGPQMRCAKDEFVVGYGSTRYPGRYCSMSPLVLYLDGFLVVAESQDSAGMRLLMDVLYPLQFRRSEGSSANTRSMLEKLGGFCPS